MSRVLSLLAAAACVMLLGGTSAPGATNPDAIAKMLNTDIAAKKGDMMSRALLLSRAEADAFWPLYREYEREREELEGRTVGLIEDYMKNYRTLDDAKAQGLLDRLFELHEQRLVLLRKYTTKLQAVVPMRQVAGFVQTEFQLLRLLDLQRTSSLPELRP